MEYLRLFENHTEYEAFANGGNMLRPNVSHCVTENDVHYNPYIPPTDPRLIAKYIQETEGEPTLIYYNPEFVELFETIEIDGVEISESDILDDEGFAYYDFGDTEEHTIKYTLINRKNRR